MAQSLHFPPAPHNLHQSFPVVVPLLGCYFGPCMFQSLVMLFGFSMLVSVLQVLPGGF